MMFGNRKRKSALEIGAIWRVKGRLRIGRMHQERRRHSWRKGRPGEEGKLRNF